MSSVFRVANTGSAMALSKAEPTRAHRGQQAGGAQRLAELVGRVQASAPEFDDLRGKGSALVVTGSSGGRTQR
jgi:hypothetical protein